MKIMCGKCHSGFNFVFEELSRQKKPCINLRNKDDAALFADALKFSKEHCVHIDGCCSSKVWARLEDLQNLFNDRNSATVAADPTLKALKAGLVCPVEEREEYCCENIANDSTGEDAVFGW